MSITMEFWEFLLIAFGPLLICAAGVFVALIIKLPVGSMASMPPLPPIPCPCPECVERRTKALHEAEMARIKP